MAIVMGWTVMVGTGAEGWAEEESGGWLETQVGMERGESGRVGVGVGRWGSLDEWEWQVSTQGLWRYRDSPEHYGQREWGIRLKAGGAKRWKGRWRGDVNVGAEVRVDRWSPEAGRASTEVSMDGPLLEVGLGYRWSESWWVRGRLEGWRRSQADGAWSYSRWRLSGGLGVMWSW